MKKHIMKQFGAWFAALKDIPTNDLLRMHINKYPEKKDYEIKEEKDENEEKHK